MTRTGKERFRSLVKGKSYPENSHSVRNSSPQGSSFQSEKSRVANDFVCCNKDSMKWLEMQMGGRVPNLGKE